MQPAATTMSTTMHTSKEEAFLDIVPIDLASIFTGDGPLPSMTKTLDQTGPWDATGRTSMAE